MIRIVVSVFLSLVFAAGCSIAPTYRRPAAPVPAEWPTGAAYKGGEGGEAGWEIGWQEFYTDERMRDVIRLALENSRDLRVATLNIERARALYRIQRAGLFPVIDASGGYTRQRTPADVSQTGRGMTVNQYFVDVGATAWELDFFGRIRSLKASALEQYLATEEARRTAEISLVAEVANVYLSLAADRDNLKLARSTLEAQLASHRLIQRRFDLGVSSALDLRQSETRVESARADVAAFTRQVALDENALNLLAGATVPPGLLPAELNAVSQPPELSAGLSSEVLLQRPDVRQSENLLKAAYANIGAARAAFFPRITLTGSVGTISTALSGLFTAGGSAWLFAPQFAVPVFDPRVRAAYDVTKVDRETSVALYEKTVQAAFREVADALAQRGTIGDQLAAQEALVKSSAEAYRLSNVRYDKGIDSFLQVLDAQRSLYAAQQGLIALRLARLTNRVTLYKVLGGG